MSVEFIATPIAAAAAPPWEETAERRAGTPDSALRAACVGERTAVERLFTDGALCVTTGQQPGLLLGPLFTLYKALTAVALARRLELRLARPVVPVFWIAGDDHDFAEAGHTYVLSSSHEPRRLALPKRAPDAPLTPLYREPLGPAIGDVLAAFWNEQPATEFRDEVEMWLGRHYAPGATLAAGFAGCLAELLRGTGLVVIQPTHPAAKTAMRPHLLRALELARHLDAELAGRAAALAAAGQDAPVPTGDGASLVMVEGAAGRDRLLLDGSGFHSRRAGERYTLHDLRDLAERSPERFSPNVLLRPAVEAALLPTVAYVAGPGELAYLPQCLPVYAALDVEPQLPVPRWSGVVVEARIRKVLDRYAIGLDDLKLGEGQLEQRLVRADLPPSAEAAAADLRTALETQYARLREAAVAIDPTLKKPVDATRNAALTGLRELEKRLLAHLKQRNETLVQQVARARAALFPLGRPQERVYGPAGYLVRYGRAFLTAVLEQADSWAATLEAPRRDP